MNFNETNTITIEINELLQKKMRFIAIMQQIYGVLLAIGGGLTCIGIVTAIIGVPMLIAGIRLFQSGSAFNLTANAKRPEDLVNAINNLGSYWMFTLIGFIAIIISYILMFVVILSLIPHY